MTQSSLQPLKINSSLSGDWLKSFCSGLEFCNKTKCLPTMEAPMLGDTKQGEKRMFLFVLSFIHRGFFGNSEF